MSTGAALTSSEELPGHLRQAHRVREEIGRESDSRGRAGRGGGCEGDATELIRRLAEGQHGVVARRQLIALGLSPALVRGRVESGYLLPLHRGVFAVGHGRINQRAGWIAAVLASGPGAVLSHGSAAALWSLRGSRGMPEVTRRAGGAGPPAIRVHQTRVLDASETVVEAGIPVTSIERTVMDMAPRLDNRQIERMLVAADRSRRLRWSRLRRLLERTPRRPGVGRLKRIALNVDPRAADALSPTEVDFLALCREAGLPAPHVNVLVEGHLVDFAWLDKRVLVEADSYSFHADRPSFERDHLTTVELEVAGYRVHRATAGMLEHTPAAFMGVVGRSLLT
jgi:hypothetical protein